MNQPIQKRSQETRARLLAAAEQLIDEKGFSSLRVEEVVRVAGVAKGTFFAHFRDKDMLMDRIIGARLLSLSDEADQQAIPRDSDELAKRLEPMIRFMTQERYVFDVIMRYSGAGDVTEIGPIAESFERQITVLAGWLAHMPVRKDVSVLLLAEGVQAFYVQAIALHFCARHNGHPLEARLRDYLSAWLIPGARHS